MRDEANYTYGEVQVSASVHSDRATPEQIVTLAKKIWRAVKDSKVAENDDKGNDALLEKLQAEHTDFNQSFPLVLRWMVQVRQFNAKALEKYLLKHATAKLDTREEFLQLQAEYLVLLYRETHAHPDEGYVRRYRESLVTQLLEEDKAFLELQKQAEADLAAQAQIIDADRRKKLYEYILAQKVAREKDVSPAQKAVGL
jgi:hypothetical protein